MTPIPTDLWLDLDPQLPVALFPVRLETRRGHRVADGGTVIPVLRVRIYPDDISVTTGSEGLSPVEVEAGNEFWAGIKDVSVGGSPAAWELLTKRVGASRAPYVASLTRPGAPPPTAAAGDRPAPTMRMLPDSWIVIGHKGGERVIQEHVTGLPATLPVGPAGGSEPFDGTHPLLFTDANLRWLSSFPAAEAVGMAVTIDLATADQVLAKTAPAWVTDGLDSLVVLGVRAPAAGRTPESEAAAFSDLITAHTTRDKVGFVAAGTPTNNLGSKRSGWAATPGAFDAFDRVVNGQEPGAAAGALVGAAKTTAESALTAALGLAPGVLATLDGALDEGLQHARAMIRAIFPVTYGEVLGTLLHQIRAEDNANQALLDRLDAAIVFTADHIRDYVRARGPLPVLRVGAQPYGVLPVTLLDAGVWAATAGEPEHLSDLVGLLGRLRPFFADAAAHNVPGIAAGSLETAPAKLVGVLGQGPVPHPGGYDMRTATGTVGTAVFDSTATHWATVSSDNPLGSDVVASGLASRIQAIALRSMVGSINDLVRGSDLEALTLQDKAHRMGVAVAATDAKGLTPAAYLGDLLAPGWLFFAPPDLPQDQPLDLLYQLIRRSLILAGEFDADRLIGLLGVAHQVQAVPAEFSSTGVSAVVSRDALLSAKLSNPVFAAGLGQAVAPQFDKSPVEVVNEGLATAVLAQLNLPHTHITTFAGTREQVVDLAAAKLDDAGYTRLLGEALACAGNRFDAWVTSVATARLDALRKRTPTGAQFGHWGYVENLRWADPTPAPAPAGWVAPDGTDAPVAPRRQIGYVHAPSMDQARTAGVLRAAEVAHGSDGSSLSSIDITSRRARLARDAIDSIAHGMPVGAVLGMRLERTLSDAGLHDAIGILRLHFPQHRASGDAGTPATSPSETTVPPEIVDGLDVWQAWRAGKQPAELVPSPAGLDAAVAELGVAVESIADALVADGVHQLVCGRAEIAGATFAAAAQGAQPPVEFDVLRTPQSGVTIQHRLVLAVDPAGAGVAGWNQAALRATVAAGVERWAETLLGSPSAITAQVAGSDAAGGAVDRRVTVADLDVCALDVVVETAGARAGDASDGTRRSLLDDRFGRFAGVVSGLAVTDGGGLKEAVAWAGAIRAVLEGARPALPDDVSELRTAPVGFAGGVVNTGAPPPDAGEFTTIAGRLGAELDVLDQAAVAVAAAVSDDVADSSPLTNPVLLEPFAALGLPGSVVAVATAGAARAGASAARAIAGAARQILDAAGAPTAPPGQPGPGQPGPALTWTQRIEALNGLLGGPGVLSKLARAIAGSVTIPTLGIGGIGASRVNVAEDELEDWIERQGGVRDAIGAYDDLRLFAVAAGRTVAPLAACQFPLADGDAWLGGPLAVRGDAQRKLSKWVRPNGPHTHVVVAGPLAETLHAIVVDGFGEVLPDPTTATGLAVHYDGPAARPPQSILLALHPDPGQRWSWELLDQIVGETIALARMRLVEQEDLAQTALDEYLPLTYVRDGLKDMPELRTMFNVDAFLSDSVIARRIAVQP